MGFIHGEKGEQGPRISEFLFRIFQHMYEARNPGFDNFYLNFEAALFLGNLYKSMWQWLFVNKKPRICNVLAM